MQSTIKYIVKKLFSLKNYEKQYLFYGKRRKKFPYNNLSTLEWETDWEKNESMQALKKKLSNSTFCKEERK